MGRVDEFVQFLKSRGYKVTEPRLRVAKLVFGRRGHFTAEELLREAPGISRATLYRTLALLVEGGFVRERKFSETSKVYENAAGKREHFHLVCVNCDRIEEIEPQEVFRALEAAAEAKGFKVLKVEVAVFGLCSKCRRKE